LAGEALENGREMRLALEANLQGDVDQPGARIRHHLLGASDAPTQHVVVWPAPGGGFELGGEVHAAETSGGGDIRKGNAFVKMGFDIVYCSSETPFRQRRCLRANETGGAPVLQGQQSGYDREAQAVGIDAAVGGAEFFGFEESEAELKGNRITVGRAMRAKGGLWDGGVVARTFV
jgi:hypothetical protein